MQSTSGESESR